MKSPVLDLAPLLVVGLTSASAGDHRGSRVSHPQQGKNGFDCE